MKNSLENTYSACGVFETIIKWYNLKISTIYYFSYDMLLLLQIAKLKISMQRKSYK